MAQHFLWEIDEGTYNDYQFSTDSGSIWMEPLRFEANETKQIGTLWGWDKENVVKDFSVTAWGTEHKVTVSHANNIKTDHMPSYKDHMSENDSDSDEEEKDDDENPMPEPDEDDEE